MAITFPEPKKRQIYLGVLLVVVIFGIIFLVWNYFFAEPQPVIFQPTPPPEIKINFEILKNPILEELEPFERILPFADMVGRENPFVPY